MAAKERKTQNRLMSILLEPSEWILLSIYLIISLFTFVRFFYKNGSSSVYPYLYQADIDSFGKIPMCAIAKKEQYELNGEENNILINIDKGRIDVDSETKFYRYMFDVSLKSCDLDQAEVYLKKLDRISPHQLTSTSWRAGRLYLWKINNPLIDPKLKQEYEARIVENYRYTLKEESLNKEVLGELVFMASSNFLFPIQEELKEDVRQSSLNYLKNIDKRSDINLIWNVGLMLSAYGYNHEAIETFRSVTDLWPYRADGWYHLGKILTENDYYEEAINALQKSIDIRPNNVNVYNMIININKIQKSSCQDECVYKKMAKNNPDLSLPHFYLGRFYINKAAESQQ